MVIVIMKVVILWRKRSEAGMDDGFNDRLDEPLLGITDQAFSHANLVGKAVEFRFLLTILLCTLLSRTGTGMGHIMVS
jgi:hypothetical protein